jgi:transcriptional regulator with XRE-family HTH domain
MGSIDSKNLVKAMDRSQVTQKRLAEELGLSLQYVCDITAGRRTLKRNPQLRARIASVLDVPTHWIEHQDAAS